MARQTLEFHQSCFDCLTKVNMVRDLSFSYTTVLTRRPCGLAGRAALCCRFSVTYSNSAPEIKCFRSNTTRPQKPSLIAEEIACAYSRVNSRSVRNMVFSLRPAPGTPYCALQPSPPEARMAHEGRLMIVALVAEESLVTTQAGATFSVYKV